MAMNSKANRSHSRPRQGDSRQSAQRVDELFQTNTSFRSLPGLLMVRRDHLVLKENVRSKYETKELVSMRENIAQMRDQKVGSIEDTGILQPLVVSPIPERPGYFALHAGYKRYLSTGDLNGLPILLEELPCIAIETRARSLVQLVENVQRSNPSIGDECLGVVRALDENPITQAQLGDLLGEGRRWVENRVKLGRRLEPARPEYQEDLALWLPLHSGKEGVTLSNLLLVADQSESKLRRQLLVRIEGGANYAQLQKLINDARPAPPSPPAKTPEASSASPSPAPSPATGNYSPSNNPSSSGGGSPSGGSRAYAAPTLPAPMYGQIAGSATSRSIEIGPSTPALVATPSAATDEIEAPQSGPLALKRHIYPANEMLAIGIRLLQSGELEQVSEAELREAVKASEKRVGEMHALLARKREAEKSE